MLQVGTVLTANPKKFLFETDQKKKKNYNRKSHPIQMQRTRDFVVICFAT